MEDRLVSQAVIKMTIDTTSCPVRKPTEEEVAEVFYEARLHRCTLKYETGVSLMTNNLCWVSGGWPGTFHDLTIARNSGVLDYIDEGELIIADKVYVSSDGPFITAFRPSRTEAEHQFNNEIKRIRQIIERVHLRIKQF